jgi:glycerol uptake facilitator-like aquaporin
LGTLLIVATVLGAGHMVADLDSGPALGLLMIAAAVGAVLFGAISALGPISGAHFNPLVTLAFRFLRLGEAPYYFLVAQFLGALSGALIANLMFELPALSLEGTERIGAGIFLGELLASFGLVVLILLLIQSGKESLIAGSVALWIVAGHIFTSSTSFANPAVTFGRMLSDAPSSISLGSVPLYFLAQLLGAVLAVLVYKLFTPQKENHV